MDSTGRTEEIKKVTNRIKDIEFQILTNAKERMEIEAQVMNSVMTLNDEALQEAIWLDTVGQPIQDMGESSDGFTM
jgi:transcriptional regulator of met regulon